MQRDVLQKQACRDVEHSDVAEPHHSSDDPPSTVTPGDLLRIEASLQSRHQEILTNKEKIFFNQFYVVRHSVL